MTKLPTSLPINLKPAIFLHIQKTAGTTIVDLARHAYGNDNVISHGDFFSGLISDFPMASDPFFDKNLVQERLGHIPFISGHFGYTFANQFMHNRYSFTFLRDPIERVLSFYYFCRSRNPEEFRIYSLSQQLSLDDFLVLGFTDPDIKGFIWNCQTTQLANGFGSTRELIISNRELLKIALRHSKEFSHVGFAETFEQDRDKILLDLGITPPQGKIVQNAGPARPKFDDLPKSTQKLLLELTSLDRVLYRKIWSRKNSFFKKVWAKWLKN